MRFLLGMAEAGFFPGVIFYLSEWFPARLRARVISRFYVALPLSSMVMGMVAGPLASPAGKAGARRVAVVVFVGGTAERAVQLGALEASDRQAEGCGLVKRGGTGLADTRDRQ